MKINFLLIILLGLSSQVFSQEKHKLIKDSTDASSITKKIFEIQELEVKASLTDANIKSGSTGLSINIKDLKQLPTLVGESDPYKALQYMGGVSQAGEASAGLYVRGGNNDQNLILLNGSLIQNPTHVLGIFSVFNPDLIEKMTFIKSGIPAEYGGRLSSVVDINTFNNIPQKFKVDGSIGLISSRIATQIPISHNFSLYASLRGSYISSLILPTLTHFGIDTLLTQNKYEYWDLNAGFIYQLARKTKLSGHFYTGRDDISVMPLSRFLFDKNATYWQNTASGIQLYHFFNEKWSMNHQLNFSKFELAANIDLFKSYNELSTQLKTFNYKFDFFNFKGKHNIRFGSEFTYNMASPHFVKVDSVVPIEVDNQHNDIYSGQVAIYFRDEINLKNWQFNVGLRANLYSHLGPYTDYNDSGNTLFAQNKVIKTYVGLEPRFFMRYLFANQSSLKISTSRHIQYLNQIPVFSFGIPADLQLPASLKVMPQTSWHFSGGYFRNFSDNAWETSIELYYKTLQHQLEFKSGITESFTNGNIEKNLLVGKGWSYGTELKIRKNTGKLTGWIAYNLAWAYRQFDQINQGKVFLARNDRRHDISVVSMYELNKRWSFSSLFVYATGNRLNLPLSWFVIDKNIILEYGHYNAFEMPAYHRLDLSASLKLKPKKTFRSELNFSIYNVYNRANPFQIIFDTKSSGLNKLDFKYKMSYLMPIIPSVSWVFHL